MRAHTFVHVRTPGRLHRHRQKASAVASARADFRGCDVGKVLRLRLSVGQMHNVAQHLPPSFIGVRRPRSLLAAAQRTSVTMRCQSIMSCVTKETICTEGAVAERLHVTSCVFLHCTRSSLCWAECQVASIELTFLFCCFSFDLALRLLQHCPNVASSAKSIGRLFACFCCCSLSDRCEQWISCCCCCCAKKTCHRS